MTVDLVLTPIPCGQIEGVVGSAEEKNLSGQIDRLVDLSARKKTQVDKSIE